MVQFSKGWRIYSALRKAKQQTRTLSKWNRTGYGNTMQPGQLKREAIVVYAHAQKILYHEQLTVVSPQKNPTWSATVAN